MIINCKKFANSSISVDKVIKYSQKYKLKFYTKYNCNYKKK